MSATESSLVAPFGIDSWVELYDSDIAKIAAGPVHYAQMRAGQSMDIDRFVRDLQEQFFECGFGVQVQVWTTEQEGAWAFVVEIQKRLGPTWDPDQMVHEVTHNLLNLDGEQEGFVDTKAAMNEMARKQRTGDIPKPHKH